MEFICSKEHKIKQPRLSSRYRFIKQERLAGLAGFMN